MLGGSPTSIFVTTTAAANLWTTSGAHDWLGRPYLADLGTHWAATYRSATGHGNDGGGVIHIRFSENEGAAWTNEDTFTDGGAVTGAPFSAHAGNDNCSGAIMIVCPNDDLLAMVFETGTAEGCYQYRSTDGGDTFTDEGRVNDNDQFLDVNATIINGVIYATFYISRDEQRHFDLYTSDDNGLTWEFYSQIHADDDASETSVLHLGGARMIALSRGWVDSTFRRYSNDMGLTWSAREALDDIAIVGMPRMKALAGGILLFGREQTTSPGGYTCVWFSPDGGQSWVRKYRPDATLWNDAAYCDVLERSDGKFYILTYGGTTTAAAIRSGVFEIA